MPEIRFEAKLDAPDAVLTLPKSASDKLPSRGMVLVEGTINNSQIRAVLQPNGQGSHWVKIDRALCEAAGIKIGGTATLKIRPTKTWPEPKVPADLKKALAADPQAQALWQEITPMARWDWLNWMGSVKLPKTLRERPGKLCSMLKAGKRRPCCFNRAIQMPPINAEPL